MKISRPASGEYSSFYGGYVSMVGEQDVYTLLVNQFERYQKLIGEIDKDTLQFAYAPNKWTVGQVMGHINDTERIMAGRAHHFSRGDQSPLPGFEENDYVANGDYLVASKESLLSEFEYLRKANLELIGRMTEKVMTYSGVINGSEVSVRALIYILAGHLEHHMKILVERYKLKFQ